MARHTAKSHKIRKVEILVIQIEIYRNDESEYPLKRIGLNFPVFKDGGEVTELLWDKGNTVERCYLSSALIMINLRSGKVFFRFIKTFERMVLFYGRQLNGTIRASLWSGQRRIANSGVIAHFNQEYVKTGVFEKGASKIIRNASELREQADYEDFYEATQEEASDVFMQASQFILEVECYLHSKSIL